MNIETGRIFRELRREKGISLAEASNGVLSVSQLSYFERGEGDLTTKKFFALLQNMDISINEFSMFSKKDSSSVLFEQAGKLEQEGNIDDLFKLYENERIIYRKTKEKQTKLNEIALKSILINYGKFERLTVNEQEVLESYFYEIKEWKFSNLRFFAFTLSQMDIESILFYLDDILEQDRLNDNDLVLMILRNTIYVLEQNNQKEKAKIYMNKFKSLIPEVGTVEIGISYATQEANLHEISGNFGAAIKILEKIAETYENFFMPKKSKIYREEIKKLQQKL